MFPLPSESTATVRLATVGTVVLTLGQLCAILTLKGVSTMAEKRRVNNHNSRKGTNGKAIKPKHNDRDFDTNSEYAEHIDSSKVSENVYKRYQIVEKECATFDEYEQAFYEENFTECLQARNKKAIEGRQPKRVQTMEQYRHNLKACPEESIFTLSNAKNPVDAELLMSVFDDFIAWHIETFPNCKVLNAAEHLDESNPHIQWRKVWTAHDGDMLIINQSKALEEMGIERPNPTEDKSRTNNAKVTYTKICREKQIELAKKYGIEVQEIAQEPTKNGKTLIRYQMDCLIEEKEGLQKQANELTEQVEQLQGQIEEHQADIEEYKEHIEDLQGQMGRLSQTVEDLTEQAGDLILQRDRLTDKVDKMQDTIENLKEEELQAHNALLKATKAPPRPKEPSKPSEYDMWTFYHPLKDYAQGHFDSDKKREERRKADYQAKEVEPYEKALQACREWDSEWGLVETAKKVLQEKEELTEKQNALRRKETALNEREQKIEQNIEAGVEKRIQSIFHGSVATGEAYRLREYCADVKFKDGTSVLDRFEQSERELEAEVRERNQVLKSSQGMSR